MAGFAEVRFKGSRRGYFSYGQLELVPGAGGQPFEEPDHIVGQVAHGAAEEAGQPGDGYRLVLSQQPFDQMEGVWTPGRWAEGKLGRRAVLEKDGFILGCL